MYDAYVLKDLMMVKTSKYYLDIHEDFIYDLNDEAVGIKVTWCFNAYGYQTTDTKLMFQEGQNLTVDGYMSSVINEVLLGNYANALNEFEKALEEMF